MSGRSALSGDPDGSIKCPSDLVLLRFGGDDVAHPRPHGRESEFGDPVADQDHCDTGALDIEPRGQREGGFCPGALVDHDDLGDLPTAELLEQLRWAFRERARGQCRYRLAGGGPEPVAEVDEVGGQQNVVHRYTFPGLTMRVPSSGVAESSRESQIEPFSPEKTTFSASGAVSAKVTIAPPS